MAHVLLIEDELWMADCYAQWLRSDGHTVRHVRDAQDALDALDDTLPELILLDLFLPYANGIQLLQTLRSHADLAHIPIILCSTALPPGSLPLEAYGVVGTIDKTTVSPRLLQQTVGEALAHAAV